MFFHPVTNWRVGNLKETLWHFLITVEKIAGGLFVQGWFCWICWVMLNLKTVLVSRSPFLMRWHMVIIHDPFTCFLWSSHWVKLGYQLRPFGSRKHRNMVSFSKMIHWWICVESSNSISSSHCLWQGVPRTLHGGVHVFFCGRLCKQLQQPTRTLNISNVLDTRHLYIDT